MFLLSYAIKPANPRLKADTVALSLYASEACALKALAGLALPHLLNFSDVLIEDPSINPYGAVPKANALLELLFQETAEQVAARQKAKGYTEDMIIDRMRTAANDDATWTDDARRALCNWLFAALDTDERDAFYAIEHLSSLLPEAAEAADARIETLRFSATDVSVEQEVRLIDPEYDAASLKEGLEEGSLATTLYNERFARQYIGVVATGAHVAEILSQSTDGEYSDFSTQRCGRRS